MKLDSNQNIIIPKEKLCDYLLSENHPIGKSKSIFFKNHGFTRNNYKLLEKCLLNIFRNNEIYKTIESEYGDKFIIDGLLETQLKSNIKLRTIWIIEKNNSDIRFITAYPI